MAPIKAVLRSKLDKADTTKSLMELVDKYEILSDVTSADSSIDDHASDSEMDVGSMSPRYEQHHEMKHRQEQAAALPTLFARPAEAAESEAMALQKLQMEFLSKYLYEQLLQQQQQQQIIQPSEQLQEQPLNLTFNPLKRPASNTEQDLAIDMADCEAKRPCNPSSVPVPRKRKRSYRISDDAEIRAYQTSAPELFAWNGHKPMIHQFLLKLLNNTSCSGLIRWLDRDNRMFKVLLPGSVARLWQFIKGNRTDNYECFARGIRHSRDIGKYFEAHEYRKKKVYKFSEKAMRPAAERHGKHEQPKHHLQEELNLKNSVTDEKPQISEDETFLNGSQSGGRNSDVLAKLKSALAGRQQQRQQMQKPEQTAVKEESAEYDDSPLVIADCDHL